MASSYNSREDRYNNKTYDPRDILAYLKQLIVYSKHQAQGYCPNCGGYNNPAIQGMQGSPFVGTYGAHVNGPQPYSSLASSAAYASKGGGKGGK